MGNRNTYKNFYFLEILLASSRNWETYCYAIGPRIAVSCVKQGTVSDAFNFFSISAYLKFQS